MAEALTPEQSARKILSIMKAHGTVAGKGVQFPAIQTQFIRDGGSNAEMEAGLIYAGEKEWVEKGQHNFLLLTEVGFGES
jgi:hypothetical protein